MVVVGLVVGREGVVEMGNAGYVPRVTGPGARQKAAFVVNEVGDYYFYKLLGELGDWGWTSGGSLRSTPTERLLDFGFGPVPKSVYEKFTRYRSVNKLDR